MPGCKWLFLFLSSKSLIWKCLYGIALQSLALKSNEFTISPCYSPVVNITILSCAAPYPVPSSRRRRRLYRGGGVVVGGDSATFSSTAPGRGVRRPPRCPPSCCGRLTAGWLARFALTLDDHSPSLSTSIPPIGSHRCRPLFFSNLLSSPPSILTRSAYAVCAASAAIVVSGNGVGVSATTPTHPYPTTMIFPTRSQVFYFVILLLPITYYQQTHTPKLL